MRRAILMVLVCATLAVAGCGGSSSKSGSSSTGGSTGNSSTGGSGGGTGKSGSSKCADGSTVGKNGVIRIFCDGTAVVNVTVAGTQHTLKGGTCEVSGGYFTLNVGAVSDATATTKPDDVGIDGPPTAGTHPNVTLAVDVGGKGYALTKNTLTVASDLKSGSFTGTAYGDNTPISGTFTC